MNASLKTGIPWRLLVSALAAISLALTVGLTAAQSSRRSTVTLNVATWNPQLPDQIKSENDAFMKAYPNIKINMQVLQPSSNYAQLLGARFSSGNPPDVAFIQRGLGGTTLAATGQLLNLGSQPWAKRVTAAGRSSSSYGGKLYSLPLDLNFQDTVFYNTQIFAKLGIAPPTNWTAFTALAQKIKAAGYIPIALGAKDVWPLASVDQNMIPAAIRKYDPNFFANRYAGKTTFAKSRAWQRVTQDLINLNRDGFFQNPEATGWNDSLQQFLDGKAAMILGGNWVAPVWAGTYGKQLIPNFKVGDYIFPYLVKSPKNAYMYVTFNTQAAIATKSKHLQAAKAYLSWLASPKQLSKFITTFAAPAGGVSGATPKNLDPLVASIVKTGILNSKNTFGECEMNAVPASLYPTLRTDIAKAWTGQGTTAQEMLQDLDKAYDSGRSSMSKAYLC